MRGLVDSQVPKSRPGAPGPPSGPRVRITYWFPAVSSRSALVTTCWPGARPERISCRLPSSIFPAWTSARLIGCRLPGDRPSRGHAGEGRHRPGQLRASPWFGW